MRLDVATVLVQLAAGGLFFCWVTTRRRVVGLGYGWLLRGVYGAFAAIAIPAGAHDTSPLLFVGAIGLCAGAACALVASVVRRAAGVSGQRARREAKAARVAAMLQKAAPVSSDDDSPASGEVVGAAVSRPAERAREFPPVLDLVAPVCGLFGLAGAANELGGPYALTLVRLVVGALFLGAISDAMLLGHWYLVQPGLGRGPIKELVRGTAVVWPFEVAVFLWPTGMAQVFTGTVRDGYHGLLGWVWALCAVSTILLVGVTWLALRERYYSAVMAATGLLYLAILTGFGTDLVARAVLA